MNGAWPMAATKAYAPRSRCLARSSILNHRLRKPRRLRRRPMNPDLRLNPRGPRNLRFNLIPNRTPQGLPRGAQEKSSQDARIRMVSRNSAADGRNQNRRRRGKSDPILETISELQRIGSARDIRVYLRSSAVPCQTYCLECETSCH